MLRNKPQNPRIMYLVRLNDNRWVMRNHANVTMTTSRNFDSDSDARDWGLNYVSSWGSVRLEVRDDSIK